MEDVKISGAKQAVQTMLFYYLTTLIGVVDDPKQYIATEMAQMIDLSEEQARYVGMHIGTNGKVIEGLSSSISLLEGMEKNGALDIESIRIVKGVLESLKNECKVALDRFMQEEKDNGEEESI